MAFLRQPPHVSQLTLLGVFCEQDGPRIGNEPETLTDPPSWRDIGLCANYSWLSSGVYDGQTYEAQNRRWGSATATVTLGSLAERCRHEGRISQSLMCLTIITALCAPISCIQDHSDSVTSELTDEITPNPSILRIWQQSNDCATALKFASSALQMIQETVTGKPAVFETPHDANCIFLCTIVACAASTFYSSQERTLQCTKLIDIAINSISHLRVGVAKSMRFMLLKFREKNFCTGTLAMLEKP